jgi:ribosomal protein L29
MKLALMRPSEIREMNESERERALKRFQYDLIKERGTIAAGGSLKNPSGVRAIRKAIARIKTINNEIRRNR